MTKLPIEILEPPKHDQNFVEFEADMRRQINEAFFVPLKIQLDWRQRFALAWCNFQKAVSDRIAALMRQ